jgi:hypothetical protein
VRTLVDEFTKELNLPPRRRDRVRRVYPPRQHVRLTDEQLLATYKSDPLLQYDELPARLHRMRLARRT